VGGRFFSSSNFLLCKGHESKLSLTIFGYDFQVNRHFCLCAIEESGNNSIF
jgi:hypothetical protein